MKIARALHTVEEAQADCFRHDNSMSVEYLLVMPGVAEGFVPDSACQVKAFSRGRITKKCDEFLAISHREPELMPGEAGRITILLLI